MITALRVWWARLRGLFTSDARLDEEIRTHVTMLAAEYERQGLNSTEAAFKARREFGGVDQVKELHREVRSFVWIEQLVKDARYGWSNLLRKPGFTLTAVIALALGIGVNATIFGIYNAVVLKQLPVADPSRVMRVKRWFGQNEYAYQYTFAYPEYEYLRNHTRGLSGLAAASSAIPVLASTADSSAPEHLNGYAVSANYFADLGVHARVGRTFLPDEDRAAGANAVVVLEYRFWQRRFQGDQRVLGQTLKLNGLPYTVIGIAPEEFTGTDALATEASFWTPLSMIDQLQPEFGTRWREQWQDTAMNGGPGFQLLARLKSDVAPANAQAEIHLLLRQFLSGYRELHPTTAVTLQRISYFGGAGDFWIGALAAVLIATVSLVLLVACANVANMLLARGVARRREIAIRLALGAGRARVVRQLLMESTLLSLLGGAAAIPLSAWVGRLLWVSLTGALQGIRERGLMELNVSPDAHVLVYGFALSLFTGILFGLAPALHSTRIDLHTASRDEGSLLGRQLGRSRLRGLLLGAQVTVSMLLLIVSGELMGGLASTFAKAAELGFEARDTYIVRGSYGRDEEKILAAKQRLQQQLAALPELSSVARGWAPPRAIPFPAGAGAWKGERLTSYASDAYFETVGIRLLQGRDFTRQEAEAGSPVAVISEATARRFWPGQDPLGKHFNLMLPQRAPQGIVTNYEVVGIVGDVRTILTELDPTHVYLPTNARWWGDLIFRIRPDPVNRDKTLAAVQSAIASVDQSLLPTLDVVSLEDGPVGVQRAVIRLGAAFPAVLAVLSLALATVGIYGVMAFLVSQRTREIGIRIALGAKSHVVVRSFLIQGLRPVFVGVLAGLAASIPMAALMRAKGLVPPGLEDSMTLAARLSSPVVYSELALVLAIAVFASVIPVRRAVRVDPVVALRYE